MKKSTFLGAIMVVTILWCASPPVFGARRGKKASGSLAQSSLTRDFPGVTHVSWTSHDGLYTAEFKIAQSHVLATYDDHGKLEQTLVRRDPSTMPIETRLVIEKKYPGYQPKDMTQCISSSTHCYYFLLKKQAGNMVTWLRIRVAVNGRVSVIQRLHQKVA